jgi:hypothetical protein
VSDRNTGHTEHQPQGKANGERPCRYSQNNEVLLRHLIPSKATQPLTARRRDDGNSLPRQTHQGFEWSVSYKGANALRACPFRFLGTPVRPTHVQARDRRAASYEFAGARVDTYEELVRTVADFGLSSGSGSGIYVALDAMTRTAEQTRDRAATLDMKAKALGGAKTAEEDPNIAAAMAAAAGMSAPSTVADRLAALRQRK